MNFLKAFQNLANRIVHDRHFETVIVSVIMINAVVIALETYDYWLLEYGEYLAVTNNLILLVFVFEIFLKLVALRERCFSFFRDPWNVFDFLVVALSLLPTNAGMATLARLVRLLRVLRVVSVFPDLRLIVDTLVRTLPSMGHITLLLVLVFFVYGVTGNHLFSHHDPEHWSSLHISMLTLFRIVTLEDWTDIMYAAMEEKPWSWVYFVSFVVLGTFVVVNLFIAVVVNNLDRAKEEKLRQLTPPSTLNQLLEELALTQISLERLQTQIRSVHDQHSENAEKDSAQLCENEKKPVQENQEMLTRVAVATDGGVGVIIETMPGA